MTQSRRPTSRLNDLQQRVADGILRAMARILDDIERRDELRERAWRLAQCTNAACRRARRCRGGGFGRTCEARGPHLARRGGALVSK